MREGNLVLVLPFESPLPQYFPQSGFSLAEVSIWHRVPSDLHVMMGSVLLPVFLLLLVQS